MLKFKDLKKGDILISNFDDFYGEVTGLVNFDAMTYITNEYGEVRGIQSTDLGGYMKKIKEVQTVWRTFSNGGHNGFFVWEVFEVLGDPGERTSMFEKCRDGSYILISCSHTWSIKTADGWLFECAFAEWQEAHIITGMPELTEIEYREFIESANNA